MDLEDVPGEIEMDADIHIKNENGDEFAHMDQEANDLEDALAGGDSEKQLSNGVDMDFEGDFNSQLNDLNRSSGVGLSKPIWSPSEDENVPQNGTDFGHEHEFPEELEGGGGEGFIDPDTDIATEGSLDLEVEQGGDIATEGSLDFDVEVPDHHHQMTAPYMPLDPDLGVRGEYDVNPQHLEHQELLQEPLEDPPQEPLHDQVQEPFQSPMQEPFFRPVQDPTHDPFPQAEEEPSEEPLLENLEEPGQDPVQQLLLEPTQETAGEPRHEPLQQEPLLAQHELGVEAVMDQPRETGAEQDHLLSDDGFVRDDEAGAITEGSLDLDVGVGEHVNEEDDDADVFEATERLDSPTSVPYVNTTIISNASSAIEPAPAHAQSLIPRSLDDVNGDASGDVMATEQGEGSRRIATGEEDITVVEPTAETELLEHKGNGDAYVPMNMMKKGFPPPFPIGYCDENMHKGNWGHKMEFMCAIFCVVFNIDSFIQFPYMMHDNGGVVFLIPYMIILFLLMLPLILSEISLGQFASSSFLTCWKFCPLLKGLSMGMLLQLFGLAFLAGPFSSHSLYYMYSVFLESGGQMVYTTCGHPWNSPSCASLVPVLLTGNDSMGNSTMAAMEYNAADPPFVNETNSTFLMLAPEKEYYINHVKMEELGTNSQGAPVTHLMICLGVAWAVVFFIVIFGIKSFGKVAYALVGFHVLLLFVLLVRGAILDGALDGVKRLFWPDVNMLLEAEVWSKALQCALLTFAPMCGIYMSLSSYNKFHNNCFMDSVVLILVALFVNLLSAVTFFTYVGYGDKRLGGEPSESKALHLSDHTTGETIFVSLAMLTATLPHAQIVSFILFVFAFLSSLSFQIVIALSIVIGFLDAIGCRHSWKAIVPACFIVCVVCFGGGLLFVTPEGPHYWAVVYRFFLPHIPYILCIIIPLALTWIYGTIPQWKFLRFQRDIKCMVGCFPIVFQGLFAGLEAIIVPLVIGVAWGYYMYLIFSQMDLVFEPYQGWHIAVAIIVAVVPLIIGFLSGAVMELCKHIGAYRYFTELFWLASMPLREWGPAVDELREEHGYPPIKGEGGEPAEESREGGHDCENINNANNGLGTELQQQQQQMTMMTGGGYTVYEGGSHPPSPRAKQDMGFPEDRSTSNELDQPDRDNPVDSNATLPAGTPLLGLSLCSHETTL